MTKQKFSELKKFNYKGDVYEKDIKGTEGKNIPGVAKFLNS